MNIASERSVKGDHTDWVLPLVNLIIFTLSIYVSYPIVDEVSRASLIFLFTVSCLINCKPLVSVCLITSLLGLTLASGYTPSFTWQIADLLLLPIVFSKPKACSNIVKSTCGLLAILLMIESYGLVWREQTILGWTISKELTSHFVEPRTASLDWLSLLPQLAVATVLITVLISKSCVKAFKVSLVTCLGVFGSAILNVTGFTAIGTLICFLCFAYILWSSSVAPTEIHGPRSIKNSAFAAMLLLVGTASLFFMSSWNDAKIVRSSYFVTGGFKTLQVEGGRFSESTEPAKAKFGSLVKYIKTLGYKCRQGPIENLMTNGQRPGIVWLINPTECSDNDIETLKGYVSEGGRLIVLGDHTDVGGIRDALNRSISFTGTAYNFDSAIPLPNSAHWAYAFRMDPALPFSTTENENLQLGIGASLSIGSNSRIRIVGERAFSDGGQRTNASNLGNMIYDPGDRLGGLPIMSESRVGKGLVQIWGDTSSFQDGPLVWNYSKLLHTISSDTHAPTEAWLRILLVIAVISIAVTSAWLCFHFETLPLIVVCVLIPLDIAHTRQLQSPSLVLPTTGQTALIDQSHLPLYPGPQSADSLTRFCETLQRADLNPYAVNSLDILRRDPEWWIVVAPARKYSYDEASALRSYVERGGHLLIVASMSSSLALRNVYEKFNLKYGNEPLGSAPGARLLMFGRGNKKSETERIPVPMFKSAAEISGSGAKVLAVWEGTPISIKTNFGKGSVVVIQDERFATDSNLGEATTVNVYATNFIIDCLQQR